MKEIGEYLKTKRLELGISLDEAEQYLKIRKKYLVAIEEGDERVLPGKTYFIGYLRNYANYLEADQQYIGQLLGENEQAPKSIEPEKIPKRRKSGKYFSPEKRKNRIRKEKKSINYLPLIKITIIIFLIGGTVFIVNQFLDRIKQSSIPVTQTDEKSLEQELAGMAEEHLQDDEMVGAPPEIFLEPLPDYKPIRIATQEPTWIKIVQDDQILFESFILSTEEITIKSPGMISLLTTSSNDIDVFYNDQRIEPQPSGNHRLMQYRIVSDNENN